MAIPLRLDRHFIGIRGSFISVAWIFCVLDSMFWEVLLSNCYGERGICVEEKGARVEGYYFHHYYF